MTNRKAQNSLLFLITLGAYLGLVLLGSASQTYAQADLHAKNGGVVDLRSRKSCEMLKDSVRGAKENLLWFNPASVWEYVEVLDSLFEAFPEKKVGWLDLVWTTKDGKRPFRLLNPSSGFLTPLPVDEDVKSDLDQSVSLLANGFTSASGFEYRVQRNAAETIATLRLNFAGVEPDIFLAAYSLAIDQGRCDEPVDPQYASVGQLALENAKISVENNTLVVVTRIPRGSISPVFLKEEK
ncbi:MAG: hypothetical protein HOP17_07685 [Acidobacteria bacterium]|nr:hypothetical protein [Acidobacteriota bacterium]